MAEARCEDTGERCPRTRSCAPGLSGLNLGASLGGDRRETGNRPSCRRESFFAEPRRRDAEAEAASPRAEVRHTARQSVVATNHAAAINTKTAIYDPATPAPAWRWNPIVSAACCARATAARSSASVNSPSAFSARCRLPHACPRIMIGTPRKLRISG